MPPKRLYDGLSFSSFNKPIGPLQPQNATSTFVKKDSQSWFGRRPTELQLAQEEEIKRRRLVGDIDLLGENAGNDENGLEKVNMNVLQNAPEILPRVEPRKLAPEELELDPAYKTIVIHPGSRWLRIGRASDAFPLTIPNVIARKSRDSKGKGKGKGIVELSNYLDHSTTNGSADIDMIDGSNQTLGSDSIKSSIDLVRTEFRTRMTEFKLRGQGNANSLVTTFNDSVVPVISDFNDPNEINWTDVTGESAQEVYVGVKAERIPVGSGYSLRTPYTSGKFDTTDYSSAQEVLADIEIIWLESLKELGISRTDLKDYNVILIIPDLYDQIYVREMSELILGSIGFKQMCMQQESLAATFGLGVSTACVVDIGAKTTKISCVEDGLILPETRISLNYGGDDITEWFLTLLRDVNFPYREVDLRRWHDFQKLEALKENMIVLSEMDVGLQLTSLYIPDLQESKTRKYQFRSYDSVILAPYLLFNSSVIDFEKKKRIQPTLWSSDVEDFISVGSGITTLAMKNACKVTAIALPTITNLPPLPELPSIPNLQPIAQVTTTLITPSNPLAPIAVPDSEVKVMSSQISLHTAIIESILSAGTDDRQKRLSQMVLVIGGSAKIHNIGFAIESRVQPILSTRAPHLNAFAIVPSPREIDARILIWKGVSSLPKLDTSKDVWVRRDDWSRLGLRAVKERHIFL